MDITRKQMFQLIKGVAIAIAFGGIFLILKNALIPAIMIVVGVSAFYFTDKAQ